MTADKLPDKLVDCANAEIAQLASAFGATWDFEKKEDDQ